MIEARAMAIDPALLMCPSRTSRSPTSGAPRAELSPGQERRRAARKLNPTALPIQPTMGVLGRQRQLGGRRLLVLVLVAAASSYKPRTRRTSDENVERREATHKSFVAMHENWCDTEAHGADKSDVCRDWHMRQNTEHRGKLPRPHKDEIARVYKHFCDDPKNSAATQCARLARTASQKKLSGFKESRQEHHSRRLQRKKHREDTGQPWRGTIHMPDL